MHFSQSTGHPYAPGRWAPDFQRRNWYVVVGQRDEVTAMLVSVKELQVDARQQQRALLVFRLLSLICKTIVVDSKLLTYDTTRNESSARGRTAHDGASTVPRK